MRASISSEKSKQALDKAMLGWLYGDEAAFERDLGKLAKEEPELTQALSCFLKLKSGYNLNDSERNTLKELARNNSQVKAWVLASVNKALLEAQFLNGKKPTQLQISSLLSLVQSQGPLQELPNPVEQSVYAGVATSLKSSKSLKNIENIENMEGLISWLGSKPAQLSKTELRHIEASVSLLESYSDSGSRPKKAFADAYYSCAAYADSTRLYRALLEETPDSEPLTLLAARSLRNCDQLDKALMLLQQAVDLNRSAPLLHLLAVYKRDNQEFAVTIKLVNELINEHYGFSQKINIAQFCADMLRKNAEYSRAYELLKSAVAKHEHAGAPLNLTVKAMLAELKENKASGRDDFFEVTSTFYDTIYAESAKYAASSKESIYVPVWEQVCDLLHKKQISKVIDIGCGPGQFAEFLSERLPHMDYLGLDFSKRAIDLARKRCPNLLFACEDVKIHTHEKGSDKVAYVMLEVLEHIQDDVGLLRLLPPRSHIIFSVPNFDSFGHVRFFTKIRNVRSRYSVISNDIYIKSCTLSSSSNIYIASLSSGNT